MTSKETLQIIKEKFDIEIFKTKSLAGKINYIIVCRLW